MVPHQHSCRWRIRASHQALRRFSSSCIKRAHQALRRFLKKSNAKPGRPLGPSSVAGRAPPGVSSCRPRARPSRKASAKHRGQRCACGAATRCFGGCWLRGTLARPHGRRRRPHVRGGAVGAGRSPRAGAGCRTRSERRAARPCAFRVRPVVAPRGGHQSRFARSRPRARTRGHVWARRDLRRAPAGRTGRAGPPTRTRGRPRRLFAEVATWSRESGTDGRPDRT
mmetsp:Transcript_30061/g.92999  ORF Transcript_30061/g.92999 Transcript_30061/m.92999 type:complete len:225 (+) Transcript_30061:3501-4175(+)